MAAYSCIYQILNLKNGKCYVGSTKDLIPRWRLHRKDLVGNKHHSKKLQRAYNKYGEAFFALKIIETVIPADLLQREQHWIDKLDTVKNGYNICPVAGNCMGIKRSEEFKKKVSAGMKGIVHSEESIRKMSLAKKGKKSSEETKKKISALKKGHRYNVGSKRSKDSLKKMRISQQARHKDKNQLDMFF